MIAEIISAIIVAYFLTVGGQPANGCQLHQRTLNPVRETISGLVPIGSSLDGDEVSGYYFNSNTGCYGYLLRIGDSVANERYFEPGE